MCIRDRLYTTGLVMHGPSRDHLSKILDPLGLKWSIQDGDLVVLGDSEFRGTGPLLVAVHTGMEGEPTFAPPEEPNKDGKPSKKHDQPVLTVRSKVRPGARPGE